MPDFPRSLLDLTTTNFECALCLLKLAVIKRRILEIPGSMELRAWMWWEDSTWCVDCADQDLQVGMRASFVCAGQSVELSFFSQSMVFFWLLYYLITSESGVVMDHVLDMLRISNAMRSQGTKVLDHAVSSVLLATAKIAIFQAAVHGEESSVGKKNLVKNSCWYVWKIIINRQR